VGGLTFQSAVYLLCLATSATCAVLLARNYARTKARLLLWSSLCFAFLALNNLIVVIDILVFPTIVDLSLWRLAASLVAVGVLLYGFIWESE
jgi:antibiotic biosynthesis monooxygenase (ABM) superfamily enzyme